MFQLEHLLRNNIKNLVPYSSARDEFKGEASVYLDANENSFGSPLSKNYNRYPDPLQWKVKEKLAQIKGVPAQNIFLGNGSDECIDTLYRAFCEPAKDNVIICPPTYGMYEVSANINDIHIREVPLTQDFQLNIPAIEQAIDDNTKLIFLCSPNNPTGNSLHHADIEIILNNFEGIVAIDEAYINFSRQKSFVTELTEYPNLVVMQTLSKAWGLAALRLGMAFASEQIIAVFNKIKYPYNIGQATQELVLEALENIEQVNEWTIDIVKERERLVGKLSSLPIVKIIYPSDANFILIKVDGAKNIYHYLVEKSIIVRDRSKVILCDDCLRITVGTPEEDGELLNQLQAYQKI